ncbi:Uncharacterised protein [Mycobacteroides abscessus subsp. abscessus]|nr:Uncharacterised protein [Mycobacteroides abscessus subsp. abscessus]
MDGMWTTHIASRNPLMPKMPKMPARARTRAEVGTTRSVGLTLTRSFLQVRQQQVRVREHLCDK